MDVPPVVRDDFIYRDTLFVNIAEGKRHPRASVAELTSLLLPSKDAQAPKDQVAHWYEAQLLHYGLPRSKDKNTAKMRLLQAINKQELQVPAHIVRMEAEMKKEYAAAIRKAKSAVKAQEPVKDSEAPVKGKKRKADDQIGPEGTKVTVMSDGMTIHIERSTSTSAGASSQKGPAKPKASVKDKPAPKEKPVAKEKPTAKEKPAPKKESAPKKEPAPKKTPAPKEKPAAKAKPKAKEKSAAKDKPATKPATNPKSKTTQSPAKQGSTPLREPISISGVWNITCADIEERSPSEKGHLRLYLCVDHDSNKLWGGFSFSGTQGVFQMDDPDRSVDLRGQALLPIRWRAHQFGGPPLFHSGCTGSFGLGEDRSVKMIFRGLFEQLPELEIHATRRPV